MGEPACTGGRKALIIVRTVQGKDQQNKLVQDRSSGRWRRYEPSGGRAGGRQQRLDPSGDQTGGRPMEDPEVSNVTTTLVDGPKVMDEGSTRPRDPIGTRPWRLEAREGSRRPMTRLEVEPVESG
ncbi:hypothetical protein VZT92_015006 [Zoarces viviparus]|uniref:Uncharacterized protein n=1 Tax=Zoarces viviparus TaxID=48416 RepID=A0AAW1EVN0_ZOAVI